MALRYNWYCSRTVVSTVFQAVLSHPIPGLLEVNANLRNEQNIGVLFAALIHCGSSLETFTLPEYFRRVQFCKNLLTPIP